MTDKLTDEQLSRQIVLAVEGANMLRAAESQIYAHCLEVYGTTPSDCDCDSLLDTVFGCCGYAQTISVGLFDGLMKEAIKQQLYPGTSGT